MTKSIILARHQSISIPPKNLFVGYQVEVAPAYPWLTLENLRPHLVRLENHLEDWLTPEECEAWAYLKEEI